MGVNWVILGPAAGILLLGIVFSFVRKWPSKKDIVRLQLTRALDRCRLAAEAVRIHRQKLSPEDGLVTPPASFTTTASASATRLQALGAASLGSQTDRARHAEITHLIHPEESVTVVVLIALLLDVFFALSVSNLYNGASVVLTAGYPWRAIPLIVLMLADWIVHFSDGFSLGFALGLASTATLKTTSSVAALSLDILSMDAFPIPILCTIAEYLLVVPSNNVTADGIDTVYPYLALLFLFMYCLRVVFRLNQGLLRVMYQELLLWFIRVAFAGAYLTYRAGWISTYANLSDAQALVIFCTATAATMAFFAAWKRSIYIPEPRFTNSLRSGLLCALPLAMVVHFINLFGGQSLSTPLEFLLPVEVAVQCLFSGIFTYLFLRRNMLDPTRPVHVILSQSRTYPRTGDFLYLSDILCEPSNLRKIVEDPLCYEVDDACEASLHVFPEHLVSDATCTEGMLPRDLRVMSMHLLCLIGCRTQYMPVMESASVRTSLAKMVALRLDPELCDTYLVLSIAAGVAVDIQEYLYMFKSSGDVEVTSPPLSPGAQGSGRPITNATARKQFGAMCLYRLMIPLLQQQQQPAARGRSDLAEASSNSMLQLYQPHHSLQYALATGSALARAGDGMVEMLVGVLHEHVQLGISERTQKPAGDTISTADEQQTFSKLVMLEIRMREISAILKTLLLLLRDARTSLLVRKRLVAIPGDEDASASAVLPLVMDLYPKTTADVLCMLELVYGDGGSSSNSNNNNSGLYHAASSIHIVSQRINLSAVAQHSALLTKSLATDPDLAKKLGQRLVFLVSDGIEGVDELVPQVALHVPQIDVSRLHTLFSFSDGRVQVLAGKTLGRLRKAVLADITTSKDLLRLFPNPLAFQSRQQTADPSAKQPQSSKTPLPMLFYIWYSEEMIYDAAAAIHELVQYSDSLGHSLPEPLQQQETSKGTLSSSLQLSLMQSVKNPLATASGPTASGKPDWHVQLQQEKDSATYVCEALTRMLVAAAGRMDIRSLFQEQMSFLLNLVIHQPSGRSPARFYALKVLCALVRPTAEDGVPFFLIRGEMSFLLDAVYLVLHSSNGGREDEQREVALALEVLSYLMLDPVVAQFVTNTYPALILEDGLRRASEAGEHADMFAAVLEGAVLRSTLEVPATVLLELLSNGASVFGAKKCLVALCYLAESSFQTAFQIYQAADLGVLMSLLLFSPVEAITQHVARLFQAWIAMDEGLVFDLLLTGLGTMVHRRCLEIHRRSFASGVGLGALLPRVYRLPWILPTTSTSTRVRFCYRLLDRVSTLNTRENAPEEFLFLALLLHASVAVYPSQESPPALDPFFGKILVDHVRTSPQNSASRYILALTLFVYESTNSIAGPKLMSSEQIGMAVQEWLSDAEKNAVTALHLDAFLSVLIENEVWRNHLPLNKLCLPEASYSPTRIRLLMRLLSLRRDLSSTAEWLEERVCGYLQLHPTVLDLWETGLSGVLLERQCRGLPTARLCSQVLESLLFVNCMSEAYAWVGPMEHCMLKFVCAVFDYGKQRDEMFAMLLRNADFLDYLVRLCDVEFDDCSYYRIRMLAMYCVLRNRIVVPYVLQRTKLLRTIVVILSDAVARIGGALDENDEEVPTVLLHANSASRSEEIQFLAVCMLSAIADTEEGKTALVRSRLWKLLIELGSRATETESNERLGSLASLIMLNTYAPPSMSARSATMDAVVAAELRDRAVAPEDRLSLTAEQQALRKSRPSFAAIASKSNKQ